MVDPYAPIDEAQRARILAFILECDDLIHNARGHAAVKGFLNGLSLDDRRALYKLAAEANATSLIVLIGEVHDQLEEAMAANLERLAINRRDGVYGSGD